MKRLADKSWEFFGANENCFQVREVGASEKRIFEAIEDENDGYRSALGELKEIGAEEAVSRNLFFNATPFAVVLGKEINERRGSESWDQKLFDGLQLVDANGHVWLEAGTDNADDYYPSFVFSYLPPPVKP